MSSVTTTPVSTLASLYRRWSASGKATDVRIIPLLLPARIRFMPALALPLSGHVEGRHDMHARHAGGVRSERRAGGRSQVRRRFGFRGDLPEAGLEDVERTTLAADAFQGGDSPVECVVTNEANHSGLRSVSGTSLADRDVRVVRFGAGPRLHISPGSGRVLETKHLLLANPRASIVQ
jgi:hypothetical protein